MKAICLLSGGIDSTVCLAIAKEQGYHCIAISFDYGQKHRIELDSAKKIAEFYQVQHSVVPINRFSAFLHSSLVGNTSVPSAKKKLEEKIDNTYVPGRNLLMLAFAASLAEGENADAIFFGANKDDHTGYPDCRPAFISSFEEILGVSSQKAVEGKPPKLITPLLYLDKKETIQKGLELGAPLEDTHSCYDPKDGKPCMMCSACVLRDEAFAALLQCDDPLLEQGVV